MFSRTPFALEANERAALEVPNVARSLGDRAALVRLCRDCNVAIANASDVTADFAYQRVDVLDDQPRGLGAAALGAWAERLIDLATGQPPAEPPPVDRTGPADPPREVYAPVISRGATDGKRHSPAVAVALQARCDALLLKRTARA